MARIRSIKPEFLRHEDLQEIENANPKARIMLVFAGLWMVADREGRFEWKPKTLKLDILPFVDFDLGKSLELLESGEFIRRYEVEGKLYGVIPSFKDHQTLSSMKHEQERYPTPPDQFPPLSRTSPGQVPDEEGKESKGNGKGKGKVKGMVITPSARFNAFWEIYPRKVAKAGALKAWQVHALDDRAPAVMAHLEHCMADWDDPHFIPHPATWLNREDFSETPSGKPGNGKDPEVLARAEQWKKEWDRRMEDEDPRLIGVYPWLMNEEEVLEYEKKYADKYVRPEKDE